MTPRRIRMTRRRPWRAEHPDAVIVARPTRWGNPYRVGQTYPHGPAHGTGVVTVQDAGHAVRLYRQWLFHQRRSEDLALELAGRDLACWCPLEDEHGNPVPCHADVLLAISNGWEVPA